LIINSLPVCVRIIFQAEIVKSSQVSTVFRQMTGSGSKGARDSQASDLSGKARAARLCYVDDSRTSAYVVKRMLKPYGYNVDHFESAEPALIALIETDYDLLLTDLKVSPTGMDGDDLVRALRASGQKKISSMPIIVITGATDTEILSQVYAAGANQIMTKPVNGEELDANIRKLVYTSQHQSDEDEFADLTAEADAQDLAATGSVSVPRAKVVPLESKKSSPNMEASGLSLGAEIKSNDPQPPLTTEDGRPIPRPSVRVKPAPRVKPTLRQPDSPAMKTPVAGKQAGMPKRPPMPNPAMRQQPDVDKVKREQALAELKKKTAARLAQQKAQRAAVKSTMAAKASQAGSRRPIDPEVLKKVKAAAAVKKAQLAAQQQARQETPVQQSNVADKPQDTFAKARTVQEQLEPEVPLTLEPMEHEPVDVFNKSNSASPGASGFHSQTPHKAEPTPRQPVNKPRPERDPATDPFADAASSAAQNFRSNKQDAHTADLFGNDDNANILQQMEQFPLVQSDFKENAGTGVMSSVNSIVELWGPKKVILAVAVIAVLAFFYNSWKGIFSDGVAVETTIVEQGEIFQSITVPGKVVSKLRVDVTPSIAGRLTNVYVEEGDEVKKGELLARLDDREAKSNLKRSEANLRNAKEDVSLAERSLKRLRQAFSKGAVARQLVEEAEVELRSAKARLSVAEEEVRTAKLSLENPRIVAPFAGTITSRYVEMGQWVVPSETLFILVDQSQREIEVRVDAADSGGIAVGQTVTLSSDAFPGLEWQESVTRLAAATTNVGNANTVSVYISLGSSAPSLRFGQQVDSEIRTAWNPSALKVPYGAIINRSGKTFVAVVQDNFVNLVEVETGIEDFSHVEIRQGVSVGQFVILANGADIAEGDRVVIESNN
jgi:RND family efflux transporter MFP subunit